MEGPDTGHPQQGCRGGAWPRVPGPGNHDGRDLGPQLVTGAAQQPGVTEASPDVARGG